MLFVKKAVGVEIDHSGVKMALVGGKAEAPRLDSWQAAAFPPDAVRFSHKDLNILNPAAFVATVKDCHLRLLSSNARISLSLPDSIGKVILVELETRLKNKEEGADIIRWKLKKNFPVDVLEAQLDYQVLRENEAGGIVVLTSLIARQVVNQYEELLLQAGLQPSVIDFTTFNLSGLLARRLELSENAALIMYCGNILSIQIYRDGILDFFRSKDFHGGTLEMPKLFREINSSLLVYREQRNGQKLKEVFYLAFPDESESLRNIILEATGLEPLSVDLDRLIARAGGVALDRKTLINMAAAVGAAARNL